MDLYLILLGIAALGILALLLIFWGRIPKKTYQPKLEAAPPSPKTSDEKKQVSHEKAEPYIADYPVLDEATSVKSDPGIASLGFNALDGLLGEREQPPEFLRIEPEDIEPEDIAPEDVAPAPAPSSKLEQPRKQPRDYIIFYLIAPVDRPFVGYELLQALLAAGLRFGAMNVFHRYASDEEQSPSLFTVASAVEPGIFDLANIGAFSCPGLSMFMSLSANEDPREAFELMLETGLQLAEDLGGTLCDDTRKILTEETVEDYRSKIA